MYLNRVMQFKIIITTTFWKDHMPEQQKLISKDRVSKHLTQPMAASLRNQKRPGYKINDDWLNAALKDRSDI